VTPQEQVEVVSANLAQRIDNFDALNSRQLPERNDSQDSHPTDGSVGLDQDDDCDETPNDPTQGWKKALDKMFGQIPARENEQNGDLNWD